MVYMDLQKYMWDARVMDTQEVLEECVRFPSYGDRYYQITAIDEYSRKRLEKKAYAKI